MDLPPQVLKQQVRELAASQDLQSLRDGASLETFGPRMPVLQAFKEFLEIERRRARRRLVAVASVLLAVLVLVLAGGTLLAWQFAGRVRKDVRTLEQALAATREENGALRGHTESMQKAIEDAQAALAAVRLRVEEAGSRTAPAPELPKLATALGLLQEVHRLRGEHLELMVRQGNLQEALRLWEKDRDAQDARQRALESRQAQLGQEFRAFASRQEDLAARLAARHEARRAAQGRAAVDAAAFALLHEIHRLQSEQPALAARQAALQEQLEQLEADRADLAERRGQWFASRTELAQAVESFLTRQQDLHARLADVR